MSHVRIVGSIPGQPDQVVLIPSSLLTADPRSNGGPPILIGPVVANMVGRGLSVTVEVVQ